MKRTNLMIDEDLLEEVVRVAGAKTYSRAVDRALRDFILRAKARRILELAGAGLWEGDIAAMRKDRPHHGLLGFRQIHQLRQCKPSRARIGVFAHKDSLKTPQIPRIPQST